MERTKANFRALRERVGLSLGELSEIINVGVRGIQRWENEEKGLWPPEYAWTCLGQMLEAQQAMIELALDKAAQVPLSEPIEITYYRSQEMFDNYGRDEGNYAIANANARAMATALESAGWQVTFAYPTGEVQRQRAPRPRLQK